MDKNEGFNIFNSFKGSTAQGKPAAIAPAKPQKIVPSNTPRGIVAPKPVSQPAALRPAPPSEPIRPRTEDSGSKIKYSCKKCGYKYALDMSVHKKNDCPWCGFTQPKE
jgi:hypothetical protein